MSLSCWLILFRIIFLVSRYMTFFSLLIVQKLYRLDLNTQKEFNKNLLNSWSSSMLLVSIHFLEILIVSLVFHVSEWNSWVACIPSWASSLWGRKTPLPETMCTVPMERQSIITRFLGGNTVTESEWCVDEPCQRVRGWGALGERMVTQYFYR